MCANSLEVVAEPKSSGGMPGEARLYAIKEIARRAGVTSELFHSWKIEVQPGETLVYVQPGTGKCIRFKNAPPDFWHYLGERTFHTVQASWFSPYGDTVKGLVPDFIIPFTPLTEEGKRPLFAPAGTECIECSIDLPLSTFLMLSRFEETLPAQRDEHDRFPAAQSIAFRDGFLDRPIVDEYGLAFEQALTYLLPAWQAPGRRLHVKISHDIDIIGLPITLRGAIGHTLRRGRPWATFRDLFLNSSGVLPTYLDCVRRIAGLSLNRGLDSAVYWKASPPSPNDSGYDIRDPLVQSVIAWLREKGIELGVHPSYETYLSPERLLTEVQALREALGEKAMGGRQHFLRWRPETWLDWESAGLAYDSTLGFADHIGFRAGTCIPYRPWLADLNREARLVEIPLVVMDCTLVAYMDLTLRESLLAIRNLLDRVRIVGGVFTLLWHNTKLIDPPYRRLYAFILDLLAGGEKFDWKAPSDLLY
jgi:hypothetical protein